MSDRARQAFLQNGAYSLQDYGAMFSAPVRSRAHVAALEASITPGMVVVELGAGAGLFSLLACRLGAARVYAIEADPIIELASGLAADNGFADRLICIPTLSTAATLPERADVLIADLRGILPFYNGSIDSMIDARDRFLKPGGVLIPRRDTLWAAVVNAPGAYESIVHPWLDASNGLHLKRARELAVNSWTGSADGLDTLLSEPAVWGTIDYATIRDAKMTGTATCAVTRASTGHGMSAWFSAELVEGIGFSNAPDQPKAFYGRAFFPWPAPVDLQVGDVVETTFRVLPGPGDYLWTWDTRILDRSGTRRTTFRQSTFWGTLFPAEDRRRRAHSHVPALSADARITRDILKWIDGRRALGDIATLLHEKYAARFPDWNAALARVADVSQTSEAPDVSTD